MGHLGAYLLLPWLAKKVGGPMVLLIGLPVLGAIGMYVALDAAGIIKKPWDVRTGVKDE